MLWLLAEFESSIFGSSDGSYYLVLGFAVHHRNGSPVQFVRSWLATHGQSYLLAVPSFVGGIVALLANFTRSLLGQSGNVLALHAWSLGSRELCQAYLRMVASNVERRRAQLWV